MEKINHTSNELNECNRQLGDWQSREELEPIIAPMYIKQYQELKWMLLNKLAQECETEMSKLK